VIAPRDPARAIARVVALLVALGGGVGCRESAVRSDAVRATPTAVRDLSPAPGALALPVRDGSIRFAVIGDSGRGDRAQHEVAAQMVAWRAKFPFDFVVMLGDNIYDSHTPKDYVEKFEEPYRALLDAGVVFHAAIGNHDDPLQVNYAKFNMGGRRYYTFRKSERRLAGLVGAGARFFVLDSRSFDPEQLDWLRRELAESGTHWKIAYFHHPIYTSGRYRATARALRLVLEPILIDGDVDVVLAGHEHVYERTLPQHGISYFVSGAAGSLRPGDVSPSPITARSFDRDYHFMLMEISGSELYFQAISRAGETVDAGQVTRKLEVRSAK
jgi:3',5'-cyclic AMP phosphodiesterase CpdA